jgi:hypothetical protein
MLKEYNKILSDEKIQSIINFFNEYCDEEVFYLVYHSSIGVKFLATDLDKEELIEIQQDYSRKSAF